MGRFIRSHFQFTSKISVFALDGHWAPTVRSLEPTRCPPRVSSLGGNGGKSALYFWPTTTAREVDSCT